MGSKQEYFFSFLFIVIRFFEKNLRVLLCGGAHTPIFFPPVLLPIFFFFRKLTSEFFRMIASLNVHNIPFFVSAVDLKENPRVVFNPTFIKKKSLYTNQAYHAVE